jgi:hypothetical protein
MHIRTLGLRALGFATALVLLFFSGWASADPPSRVARLGYTAGPVSFSPAGEEDWVQARLNRPLANGDRLWTDAGAQAEIQVGGAAIRMAAHTSVAVLNLDDQMAQLQLTQGTLNLRLRYLAPNQVFEVNTPNLAVTLRHSGDYRIEVDLDGHATDVIVRSGQGEVYGDGAAFSIGARQSFRFFGTGLSERQYIDRPGLDAFDLWAAERDRVYDNSTSARYVSQDVVGYQDLDAHGTWREDPSYGNVWIPNQVGAGWAPYRNGHWTWIRPWGWTWVDDAPWGYAVSHYGRWAHRVGGWCWVPGPVSSRAWYAPALVAFIGGRNFQIAISGGYVGGVAWFPLAPRELYQPSYRVSRGYFENVNRSNTVIQGSVINNTVVNNHYRTTNVTNVVYANQRAPGAVTAVSSTAFVSSHPVAKAAVHVTQDMVASAPVAVVAPMAPSARSVHGAAATGDTPPARVFERRVVARSAAPASDVGFATRQQQLSANPARPAEDEARKELKQSAPAPAVRLAAPARAAPATELPASTSPTARSADSPSGHGGRRAASLPEAAAGSVPLSVTPQARPSVALPMARPTQVNPSAAATQAPLQRAVPRVHAADPQAAQPMAAAPPARSAQALQHRAPAAIPEFAAGGRQAEPRASVAASKRPAAPLEPAPSAEPRDRKSKHAARVAADARN